MTALLLGAALWALTSCASDVVQTAAAESPISVRLHVVQPQQAAIIHRTPGTVLALERAEIATPLAGRLTQITVREGDRVEADQLLARIDVDGLNAAVAQAQAGLNEAGTSLDLAVIEAERAEVLHAQQALPEQARDRAVATRERAVAAVDAARRAVENAAAQRSYGFLRAPFSGIVVRRLADVGDLTNPARPVLVVERTDSVRVVTSIPESDVSQVGAGDAVRIDCGTTTVTGTVHSVVADEAARRMFQVQVLLAAGGELQAGRFAHLTYETGVRSSLRLPQEAIVTQGQLQGAFVVSHGRALLRWLRLGEMVDGTVEVLSGLHAGDRIAVGGAGLRDGARIAGG